MKCPKCQMTMRMQDRVCRRCLYCPELDSYIDIEAPRGSHQVRREDLFRSLWAKVFVLSSWATEQHSLWPALYLVAGIIPGAGLILAGRKIEGTVTAIAVCGLVYYCLFSDTASSTCMPLLGIAFGLHIMSLFRMTSTIEYTPMQRLFVYLIMFMALGGAVYGPIADLMLRYKPEVVYRRYYGNRPDFDGFAFLGYFPIFILAFVIAWAIGKLLSFIFSLPEGRRT